MEVNNIKTLFKIIDTMKLDGIIVEGYDGVGKGYILSQISDEYNVVPYRPEYNLWNKHDLRYQDRWKISGFFWDVFSHFNHPLLYPLLFDRGVISGAVYNNDESIAKDYGALLRGKKEGILHILVTTSEDSYYRFNESRDSQQKNSWEDYIEYTDRYIRMLDISGVSYIIYQNEFNEEDNFVGKCGGCGHYNYGICRHPSYNGMRVDSESQRCEYSKDQEVQDVLTEV